MLPDVLEIQLLGPLKCIEIERLARLVGVSSGDPVVLSESLGLVLSSPGSSAWVVTATSGALELVESMLAVTR